jgi:8-oxo-dGTP pyrophosphatase MutT (NUDIX family)
VAPKLAGGQEEEAPGVARAVGDDTVVRAGGGVVWRRGPAGPEVVLVHRPAYDDWSLPKGKCDPGEPDDACALREVKEETGLTCELGPELPSTAYRDRHGRRKVVRYWRMRPVAGDLAPDLEVDQAVWRTLEDAREALTYERDKQLLDAFAAAFADGS